MGTLGNGGIMVWWTGLEGLEPTTLALGKPCSIQLSHSPTSFSTSQRRHTEHDSTRLLHTLVLERRRGDRGTAEFARCVLRKVRAPPWPGLLGNAQCG